VSLAQVTAATIVTKKPSSSFLKARQRAREQNKQKFFVSFFQKRNTFLLPPLLLSA
jgi:hypothetical protein